ncbi:hypothetical protein [Flexithrix dorotheae]|nr:hypothetical protein [Flexithrix dorotheae]
MIKPSAFQVMTKKNRKGKIGKHTDNWDQLTGSGLGGHHENEN